MKKKGFTLLECLIVLAIIAGIVFLGARGFSYKNDSYCKRFYRAYEEGMKYYIDTPIHEFCASYKIEKTETHTILELYDVAGVLIEKSLLSHNMNYTVIKLDKFRKCRKYFRWRISKQEKKEKREYNRR